MSDYKVHSKDTAPESAVPLLEKTEGKFGFLPNLFGVLAESPAALEGYVTLMGIFNNSSFTPAEQQILLLTTSRENDCEYCVAAHTGGAKRAEVAKEVIDAVRDGNPIPDPRLRALSGFCAAVVNKRGWVTEEDLGAFLNAGFDKAQVLEVVLAIAVKTISNYSNHIVETPLDEAFKPLAWKKGQARNGVTASKFF